VTSSALNGLSARGSMGEKSYKQETRRMFVGWKAKYGKTYATLVHKISCETFLNWPQRQAGRLTASVIRGRQSAQQPLRLIINRGGQPNATVSVNIY
jgi:hypothetical protein